jgi:hypothetical protein
MKINLEHESLRLLITKKERDLIRQKMGDVCKQDYWKTFEEIRLCTLLNCPHALKFCYRGSFCIVSAVTRGAMKNLGSDRRLPQERARARQT